MRIPFLRPQSEEAAPAKAKRPRMAKAVPQVDDVMDVQTARTQARRRLVGALVLLLIGIVGFPILFETKPRPLPMDTPMEAVRRDAAAGGLVVKESALTPTPTRAPPVAMPPADAGNEEAPAASAVARTAASAPASAVKAVVAAAKEAAPVAKAPAPAVKASATPASPTPAAVASAPAAPKPAAVATAPAPAAKPAAEPASADGTAPRYVVQAGAYKESGKLREARSKIEGLGYKTYTQVVENENGSRTRVRVGPYPTQEEAEAVAAKIKKNGLPAAIVKL